MYIIFWSYIDTLGGANFWNRLQNIHNCGAGDFVWDFEQLGAWCDLLGWEDGWGTLRIVTEKI